MTLAGTLASTPAQAGETWPDISSPPRTRTTRDRSADAALIEFGRELFGDHRVAPETYARFAAGYDRRTLVDLVNLMGMYAMTAAVLIAFDAQLPEGVAPGLPAG